MTPGRVVVVGASVAGLTVAETLRVEGFTGDVLLVGDEPELPYARPPLSKQVLSGVWTGDEVRLRSAQDLARLGIRTRIGEPATGIDVAARLLRVGDEDVPYDVVVLATGVAARRPAWADAASGVRVLRTIADARLVGAELRAARRVVVVGSGVLGSEIASVARAAGRETVLVGRSPDLSFGAVGRLLSDRLAELHRAHDVRLLLGTEVRGARRGSSTTTVTLTDGTAFDGDLVVAATGGTPRTEWLDDPALTLDDGVVCDRDGRAAPGVFAAGDVARWADPVTGVPRRVEHQTNAIEQGIAVATTIARGIPAGPRVPFFWSELHGTRIQAYGTFPPTSRWHVLDEAGPQLVLGAVVEDTVRGVVGWNAARRFRAARSFVDDSTNSDPREANHDHPHGGLPLPTANAAR